MDLSERLALNSRHYGWCVVGVSYSLPKAAAGSVSYLHACTEYRCQSASSICAATCGRQVVMNVRILRVKVTAKISRGNLNLTANRRVFAL
jgi:hypothetical protein